MENRNKTAYVTLETQSGYELLSLETELMRNRNVFLIGEVNDETCDQLIKQFMCLDLESRAPIRFFINSPGGEVTSGLALYDVISMLNSPVDTICTGTAASMGSILFLAGRERYMLPHTRLMIHDPSYGSGNIGGMKPFELQQQVDKLKETGDILADIIADKTGKTVKEIKKITQHDTYYNAQEAIKFGLATKIMTRDDF